MLRENQFIVFNIFLYGSSGSGRNSFLHFIVENRNLLDANFLEYIESEKKKLKQIIDSYISNIKELPPEIKRNIDHLFCQKQDEEAKTYFEIASYQIQEMIKAYDEELNKLINESIIKFINQKSDSSFENEMTFSSIDITGSIPNVIFRIHYTNKDPPDLLELNNFLSTIDGLIFIWDAQRGLIEANIQSFQYLFEALPVNTQIPLVFALNKIDLPHIIHTEDLRQLISQVQFEEKLQTSILTDSIFQELTIFETIATQGYHVNQVLMNCFRMVVLKNQAKIQEIQNILRQEAHV
ncbi:MAG TPA: hypothetical protein VMV49_18460 [Candidatus Deferrimicrobium sp.]|nr:hypothetical protein [Candidatus Deferrimicrobium sp.]